jgi:hypothetical protein
VFATDVQNDVSYGALRLIDPSLASSASLTPVAPLDVDLHALREEWRTESERMELAA